MHPFIHTLGIIPRDWYLKEELKRKTMDWNIMANQFFKYFSLCNIDAKIHEALKSIKRVLFPFESTLVEFSIYRYFSHLYDSRFHEIVD